MAAVLEQVRLLEHWLRVLPDHVLSCVDLHSKDQS